MSTATTLDVSLEHLEDFSVPCDGSRPYEGCDSPAEFSVSCNGCALISLFCGACLDDLRGVSESGIACVECERCGLHGHNLDEVSTVMPL